jgi:hypothetical protein
MISIAIAWDLIDTPKRQSHIGDLLDRQLSQSKVTDIDKTSLFDI